jgi:hypothetical protein
MTTEDFYASGPARRIPGRYSEDGRQGRTRIDNGGCRESPGLFDRDVPKKPSQVMPMIAIAPRHLLFNVPRRLIKTPLGASFPSSEW